MAKSKINDQLKWFGRFVRRSMKDWDIPGAAVGIVKGGRTIYTKGFSLRDVNHDLPVTENTLFGIASCTKAFTATAIGILVDEGKLAWDKPVREYLPEFKMYDPVATEQATLRDLLTHRTGLPRHDMVWSDPSATREELLKRLGHLMPSKDFRSVYQYNSLMYMAAGAVLEKVTGQTWEQFVKERILFPVGMNDSRFWTDDFSKEDNLALGYLNTERGIRPAPRYAGSHNMPYAIAPAGSIVSNVGDMCRWLQLQMRAGKIRGNVIVSERNLSEIHTPQMVFPGEVRGRGLLDASYAIGWIVQPYRGYRWIHHYGGFGGFTALMSFMPDESIGVVVLVNRYGAPPFATDVSFSAYERILGLEHVRWRAKRKGDAQVGISETRKTTSRKGNAPISLPHPLKEYLGDYCDLGYGRLTVCLEHGRLVLYYNDMAFKLKHLEGGCFAMIDRHGRECRVTFASDKMRKPKSLAIPFELAVSDIVFKRTKKRLSRT